MRHVARANMWRKRNSTRDAVPRMGGGLNLIYYDIRQDVEFVAA